jgi:hypothetical protein
MGVDTTKTIRLGVARRLVQPQHWQRITCGAAVSYMRILRQPMLHRSGLQSQLLIRLDGCLTKKPTRAVA